MTDRTASLPADQPGASAAGFPIAPLALSLLVQTVVSFPNMSFSPLAPFLQPQFGISREQFGLLVTAQYLGSIVTMMPAGQLADRLGVRPMFGLGMLVTATGVALMALAPLGWAGVLLGSFVAGIGNGIALPPTTRAIMDWYPAKTRTLAMSIKQTGVAVAGAAMGWLIPPLAAATGVVGALVGVTLMVAAAGVVSWGAYRDPVAAVGGGRGGKRPGMGAVLCSRPLLLLGLVSAIYGLVQLSVVNFLVLFLTETFGYSVALAGVLLGWTQLTGAGARIFWGAVSEPIFGGRRRLELALIGGITAVATLALSLLQPEAPFAAVAGLVLLLGSSAIGWNAVQITYVAEIAGKQLSATAAAMSLTMTYLGIIIGPPIFGRIVDTTGSYSGALRGLTALALMAVALLLTQREQRPADAG